MSTSAISGTILSIDGGGIRGIIPAMVLAEIETRTGKAVSQLFDLIGGTSTGGILALGLTMPRDDDNTQPEYSALDMVDMYSKESDAIFGDKHKNATYIRDTSKLTWGKRLTALFNNYKYYSPINFFDSKFKNAMISSCLTDVVIITNEWESIVTSLIWRPFADKVKKNIHFFAKEGLEQIAYTVEASQAPVSASFTTASKGDFGMNVAATFTSAAPGFFPLIDCGKNFRFFDGGILQNNPTLPCYYYAKEKGYGQNPFILSLGTGAGTETILDYGLDYLGALDWEETAVKKLSTPDNIYRIQPTFEDEVPQLDDIEPETINKLQRIGKQLIEKKTKDLDDICKVLDPSYKN